MSSEIDIAFSILRSALDGTKPAVEFLETNRWWSLFRLLQQNHVASLSSEAFTHIEQKPPREILIPWLSERQKAANWYKHQRNVQQEILDLMQHNGIKTLVLKGTHLAQLYPQPDLREFGDIDLYFYDHHDDADTLAKRELKVDILNLSHHHTKYNYRGVTVESHYDFVNASTPPSNKHFEKLLKELAPSPLFEVLFLLRHMAGHFASNRITLRDLCDWHLLTTSLTDKIDWESVEQHAEEAGMADFLHIINTLVKHRLGNTTIPDTDHDRTMAKRVEQDIVYGNLNQKQEYNEENIGRLWWKLKRYCANNWKRRLVYRHDSATTILMSSLTSHILKPKSILHKM